MKDECGICGRVLQVAYMRKCQRCKKLFCRDCMVPDVATGDPNAMLCLHCARRVVSSRTVGKYDGLANHLKFRAAFTGLVRLSFARIDGLIGSNLPINAFRDEAWWSNSSSSRSCKSMAECRLGSAGDQPKRRLCYLQESRRRSFRKSTRLKLEINKPFTPVPVHRPRSKVPSKTKVSKLYARIKNMERNRALERRQIKGFKPRRR